MNELLRALGIVAALAAIFVALIGANVDAHGQPQGAHPTSSVGLGLAALALIKAGERRS
ncbi:MAG: hypothetical protein H6708_29490 [Kofleriaceae bacterium]|nr:hypothetical protein [Kofleriaceae bacterium]